MSPVDVYLGSLAPSTRRVMAGDLRAVARVVWPGDAPPGDLRYHPWASLTIDQGVAVQAAVAARYAPGTANRVLSAVRGVVRASWTSGAVTWDAHLRLLATLRPVRGGRVTRGRSLTRGQLDAVLEAAGGLEERALLAVLAGCGARRAEAIALTWDRLTRHDTTFYLRILGKGNRERRLRVPSWVAADLNRWRRAAPDRPAVFRWRSGESIRLVVSGAAARAGVGPLSPHDLRRTFFELCRSAGLDLATIRRTMGHASILTTVKYDRRPDEAAMEEMARLDTPSLDR